MRVVFIFLFIFLYGYSVEAQTTSPEVIAAGGEYYTATNFTNAYTVGEIAVVTTVTTPSFTLTQGFHQPFEYFNIGINDNELSVETKLFPNPAKEYISFMLDADFKGQINITIYNSLGQAVFVISNMSFNTDIDNHISLPTRNLSVGNYLLQITFSADDNSSLQTINKRFVKIR